MRTHRANGGGGREPGTPAGTAARIARGLSVPVRPDEPLGPRTTMGIGGPTPCLLEPRTAADLAALLRELSAADVAFRVLGAGSNLLVDDRGVSTPVVSTAALAGEPAREGDVVTVPAGALLPKLVRQMAAGGLGGFEFLEGIPGSVGGSIRMNAGAGGRWIGDVVESVEVVFPGGPLETVRPGRGDFGYRRSFVAARGLVVTAATLRGAPDEPEAIRERIRDSRAYRVTTQPLAERSSGCVFRNPEGSSAGALLDRLALKGISEGGAVVSERHANFILNRGATFDEVLRLIERLREAVRRAEGAELALEVEIWSDR